MNSRGKGDWVPRRQGDFKVFCEKWRGILLKNGNSSLYKWDDDVCSLVVGKLNAYIDAYNAYKGNDTTQNHIVMIDSEKEVRSSIRAFANASVRHNRYMDTAAKADMGVYVKSAVRTPVPVPVSRVIISGLKALGGFQVEIRFYNEDTPASRAIPYGCNGCLLNYAWGDERVWDYAKITETKLMTRFSWILQLPPEAEGKLLSCAGRWQNSRGQLGPWSEISHVVIA